MITAIFKTLRKWFTPTSRIIGFDKVNLNFVTSKCCEGLQTLHTLEIKTVDDLQEYLTAVMQTHTLEHIHVAATDALGEKILSVRPTYSKSKTLFTKTFFTPSPSQKYLIFVSTNIHAQGFCNKTNMRKGFYNPLPVENARELFVRINQIPLETRMKLKLSF